MSRKSFEFHLADLERNRQIQSHLDRMRNATGPMAHVAGVYALGSCETVLDAEPGAIQAMSANIKMMTLLLIWGEGGTLNVAWLSNPRQPLGYRYKSRKRTITLDRGWGRAQLYTMTPIVDGQKENELFGFAKKGIVFHKEGNSWGIFARCGGAGSAAEAKLRTLLAHRAEHAPKSPDAR